MSRSNTKKMTQPWTIHRKKDLSRRKYYYNKITKDTTWIRPSTLGPEILDDAYYEKRDKRSGKTYYVWYVQHLDKPPTYKYIHNTHTAYRQNKLHGNFPKRVV